MNSIENVRRWLCEHFTEKDWKTVEELRNGRETHARHPIVSLICGSRDSVIAQTADLDFAFRAIRSKDRNWAVKGDLKSTLLIADIPNCTAALAEIRARGFLTDIFPDTKKVSRKKGTKTPDFEIPGPEGDFVFIEVHTKLMSQQMHDKLSDFYEGLKDGTIGTQRGKVRVGSIVVQPFTGETRGTVMTDPVSKLSNIKVRSEQLNVRIPSIVWMDFEPWRMLPFVRAQDSLPLCSDHTGLTFSGTLWSALYGTTGFPLLNAFPRNKVVSMPNAGMFEQNNISAVIAAFEHKTVLLENPTAESVLPEWFRNQFFHIRGFSAEHCIMNTAPGRAGKIVAMQKEYVAEFASLQVIPEW